MTAVASKISRTKGMWRFLFAAHPRRVLIAVVIASFVILYSLAALPFFLNSTVQDTGNVLTSKSVSYGQVPSPMNFYLTPGEVYTMFIIQQVGGGEVYAVISSESAQAVSGLVFLRSQSAQWYVGASPAPIPINNYTYDRLAIGSLGTVSQASYSSGEYWLSHTQTGMLLLEMSTTIVYIGPLFLIAAIDFIIKRIAVWSIVLSIWFYALVFFIPGILGSGYGLQISDTLGASLVGLLLAVLIVSKLENAVRRRLAVSRGVF